MTVTNEVDREMSSTCVKVYRYFPFCNLPTQANMICDVTMVNNVNKVIVFGVIMDEKDVENYSRVRGPMGPIVTYALQTKKELYLCDVIRDAWFIPDLKTKTFSVCVAPTLGETSLVEGEFCLCHSQVFYQRFSKLLDNE